ncbi:MAG: oxidoreductase [Magnetospirillum sp.]|nr:oxidoreductase [Magnetospirillum sp.]
MSKTLLITGVSSGFGRALAEAALADGHRVVGTLRNADAARDFDALRPGRSFGRVLDVADTAAIAPLVEAVERDVGAIDALVNNAGYGHQGTVEETPLAEWRHQFDVNVFGAVAMIQAVLPYMRKRRSGHILNITSMGGFITFPGLGVYHGSKFALEGISETLGKEVAALGIRVTAIEPGGFRTHWAGRSLAHAARTIADYDIVAETSRTRLAERNGRQPGDPAKAARAMLEVIAMDTPPAHLLLGSDAVQWVHEKLAALTAELRAWEALSLSTDY